MPATHEIFMRGLREKELRFYEQTGRVVSMIDFLQRDVQRALAAVLGGNSRAATVHLRRARKLAIEAHGVLPSAFRRLP